MEPIVFIDSLDNISIVNLDVPSLSPDMMSHMNNSTDGTSLHHHHHHDHCDNDDDNGADDDMNSCDDEQHFETQMPFLDILHDHHICNDYDNDTITNSSTNCLDQHLTHHQQQQQQQHYRSATHQRRTISSLDRVRTWKKYAKKKHLTQAELDRKRDLANKQERRRMHRLNEALDKLRKVIPSNLHSSHHSSSTSSSHHAPPRRLSKIKTLQSAIKYIKWLQEKLQTI